RGSSRRCSSATIGYHRPTRSERRRRESSSVSSHRHATAERGRSGAPSLGAPPGSERGLRMPEAPALPISIWVTGSPVPPAEQRAGSFADMIRAGVGGAWRGPWSIVDVVDESAPLPAPDDVAG